MSKYFTATTLDELKKEYKKLAFKYHPDSPGGDLKVMQEINNEYDKLFEKIKSQHNENVKATNKGFATNETVEQFKDIINIIIHMQGIVIEICGNWVWVTGDTKQHKDVLKVNGFLWAPKKSAWYWRAEDFKSRNKKQFTLDEIRSKYGSDTVNPAGAPKALKKATT